MGEVIAIRQLRISSRATMATAALLAPILLFMGTCFILPLVELLRLSFTGGHGPLWAYREIAESEVYRRVFVNTLLLALNVARSKSPRIPDRLHVVATTGMDALVRFLVP